MGGGTYKGVRGTYKGVRGEARRDPLVGLYSAGVATVDDAGLLMGVLN